MGCSERTLKNGVIRIEDVAQQIGMATTSTLDPEPVPFTAKVVLIGERMIYHLLFSLDPDFPELFKVKADFDTVVERTADERAAVRPASSAQRLPRREPPATSPRAVWPASIEQASRMVEDQQQALHPLRRDRRPGAGVRLLGRASQRRRRRQGRWSTRPTCERPSTSACYRSAASRSASGR